MAVYPPAVTSVAARTGAVVLTKTDVGLSNVDNTTDAAKPVSTAQAAANALKVAKTGDTITGRLFIVNGVAGNVAESFAATGDIQQRFMMYTSGVLDWGPGNAAQDTNLYRSAADTLKTDDSLIVGATLKVTGNVGFNGATPAAKPTITGSRGGNAALADLITNLAAIGLITDGTSA